VPTVEGPGGPDAAAAPLPLPLGAAVLAWYGARGRALPFRGDRDPYRILVSELMAQQTQVARAAEAWVGFVRQFPTVESLAAASPGDVLRAWRGLGYNRRALGLWRAARAIVDEHDGRVPADVVVLQRLPGVGPYTARAVAALAYGIPVGAVDTNVRRVLGRIVAGDPARLGPRALQAVADAAVPPDRPGDWTHALMDVGATVCKPRRPLCHACPAEPWCRAAADGIEQASEAARASALRARAAPAAGASRRPRSAGPFPATTRWLRGRILDRLRDTALGNWTSFDQAIGEHPSAAVAAALVGLAGEGLVELHPDQPTRARLPTA
jgi:A/G-specific adenine glycosylase